MNCYLRCSVVVWMCKVQSFFRFSRWLFTLHWKRLSLHFLRGWDHPLFICSFFAIWSPFTLMQFPLRMWATFWDLKRTMSPGHALDLVSEKEEFPILCIRPVGLEFALMQFWNEGSGRFRILPKGLESDNYTNLWHGSVISGDGGASQ